MNDCKIFYWGVWLKFWVMFQIWLMLTAVLETIIKIYMDFCTHLLYNLSIACESERVLDRQYSEN